MSERSFRELLKKYLEGRATPEERELVDDWYDMLFDKDRISFTESEMQQLRKSYWQSLQGTMSQRRRRIWAPIAIAASLAAVIVASVFFLYRKEDPSRVAAAHPETDFELIENKTDGPYQIMMVDGSVVRLSPGSHLRVSHDFNGEERVVELSGEAFFNISRDERRPFIVYANEVVTKVLGTSFTVVAYPDAPEVKVAVASGKVSVSAASDKHGKQQAGDVILEPNQQAIYSKSEGRVLTTLVKTPVIVIPEEEVKKIRFKGAPVAKIFRALEKMYGVDIEFSEEDFANCSVTTSATGDDLFQRIDVICEITGATYVIDGTRIRVSGSGCH